MSNNFTSLWKLTLKSIKNKINDKMIYDSYIKDTYIHSIEDNNVIVIASEFLAKEYLISITQIIEELFNEVTESNYKISFLTINELELKKTNNISCDTYTFNNNLNKDFSFDSFVVGKSNEEAFKASLLVATNPGKLYNPLFLYSQSGLGKTHLIHSIGNYIYNSNPNLKILYVTSDQFLMDYLGFVQSNDKSNWFNDKYRSLDVLLIDDIQFFKDNQVHTQEMFFNIYNDLYNHNKQIIITSDVIPNKLENLEERLVSRFNQGLSIGINQPDFDTIIKILKKKINYISIDNTINISDDALEYIACNFSKNVRELEGVVNRILLYNIDNVDTKINKECISNIFKDFIDDNNKQMITSSNILKAVCLYYNFTKTQITSKSRIKKIAMARHIAIYLDRHLLETPFDKIGTYYGNRDHTTAMHSYNLVRDAIIDNDEKVLGVIAEITRLFKTK